ncbi:MAG: hypothetical protein ACYCOU_00305 [Sulfobacillus sp.]
MTLDELKSGIAELLDVAPTQIEGDSKAAEAARWLEGEKIAEIEAEEILGPAIKTAFERHRTLTGQRKKLLENLLAAKDGIRAGLAQWIAAGHQVENCAIRTKYKVTVTDVGLLPPEYWTMVPDLDAIQKEANASEGRGAIPGCAIEVVHTLYQGGGDGNFR